MLGWVIYALTGDVGVCSGGPHAGPHHSRDNDEMGTVLAQAEEEFAEGVSHPAFEWLRRANSCRGTLGKSNLSFS